jgi:hypothetical protein
MKVGIFFYVAGKLITAAVPLENGEPYADSIGFGSHYEFWTTCMPKNPTEVMFKNRAYDAFPRGRVVYFPRKNRFVIYADRCIKASIIKRIAS